MSSKFYMSDIGMTYHKATYKPSLPSQMNFTPGIKYEIARFTGKYPSDLLIEVA